LIAATLLSAATVFMGPDPALAKAPVTANDTYAVVAGTTFTLPAPGVLVNDTGVAPGAEVHWQTSPPAGFTLADDGGVTYVVPAAASGTASFTYCVVDLPDSPSAQCVSNLATVTVHIAAPITVDDTYDVVAGTTFTVAAPGVLANDTNLPNDPVVHAQTNPPPGLILDTDGSIRYPVPAGAPGSATFTYCIVDLPNSPNARCVSNLGTVTIRVVTSLPTTPAPTTSVPTTSVPTTTGPTTAGPAATASSRSAAGAALPQTGAATGILLGSGLVFLAAGVAILIVLRRRTASGSRDGQ
jgi:LPXTG-motif cell wall-anchored protein